MRRALFGAFAIAGAACAFDLPEPTTASSIGVENEAGTGDATTSLVDAGAGSEAGSVDAGFRCAGELVCSDFETTAIEALFPKKNGNSTCTASHDHAVSGTTSILIETPAVAAGEEPELDRHEGYTFKTPMTKIRIGMSVWIAARSDTPPGFGAFCTIFIDHAPAQSLGTRLYFNDSDGKTLLEQAVYNASGGPHFINSDPLDLPSGRWVRLERDIDLAVPNETVSIDGVKTVVPLDPAFGPTKAIQFDFGFEYVSGPSKPYRIYIDDFILDAH